MSPTSPTSPAASRVPTATLDWLLEPENPTVAVLTRRTILGAPDDDATAALWSLRNDYEPVARILAAMRADGSWDTPARDYEKYRGSLWQIVLLGELHARGDDERIQRAAGYAFSRQLPDGSWSASNKRPAGSIPCLTANVARGLARMGYARDERVIAALAQVSAIYRDYGFLACPPGGHVYTLNGYCHMLAPKLLLLLSEVPRDLWPEGAEDLRVGCVAVLRDKQVFRCLPREAREFADLVYAAKAADREAVRDRFVAQHPDVHYGDKPGWLRFGFPLSYNSDALEALVALAAVGEVRRPEYEPALEAVAAAADAENRWTMRNSLNGKMFGDVEAKGRPSKWLTLRALNVLDHFGA
jgi:hypothetical protein